MELGSALLRMLDAARLEGDAKVIVSCEASRIVLSSGRRVDAIAESASDLSSADEIALQILGWRPDGPRGFVRSWHGETPSDTIADDIVRTTVHGFQCATFELQLELASLAHV